MIYVSIEVLAAAMALTPVQAWWREEAGAGPFLATVEKVHTFSQTYTIVWDDGGSEQRTRPASEVWRRDTVIDDDMTPGEEDMESSVPSVGSSDTEMTYFYPVSPHAPDSAPWQLQTAECKLQSENWSEQPRGKAQSVPGVDAGAGDGPAAEAEEPVPGSATVEPDTGGSSSPQPTTSEDEQGEHEEQVGEEDNDDDDDESRAAMAKAKRASLVQALPAATLVSLDTSVSTQVDDPQAMYADDVSAQSTHRCLVTCGSILTDCLCLQIGGEMDRSGDDDEPEGASAQSIRRCL